MCLRLALWQVPNLRLQAAQALASAAPSLSAHVKTSTVVPALQERLTHDDDIDVKFFAEEALKNMGL